MRPRHLQAGLLPSLSIPDLPEIGQRKALEAGPAPNHFWGRAVVKEWKKLLEKAFRRGPPEDMNGCFARHYTARVLHLSQRSFARPGQTETDRVCALSAGNSIVFSVQATALISLLPTPPPRWQQIHHPPTQPRLPPQLPLVPLPHGPVPAVLHPPNSHLPARPQRQT